MTVSAPGDAGLDRVAERSRKPNPHRDGVHHLVTSSSARRMVSRKTRAQECPVKGRYPVTLER